LDAWNFHLSLVAWVVHQILDHFLQIRVLWFPDWLFSESYHPFPVIVCAVGFAVCFSLQQEGYFPLPRLS